MLNKFLFLTFITSLLSLQSCGNDEDPQAQLGQFDTGSFIINQGPFGSGTGNVIHIGDDNAISADIFQSNNAGAVLGNVVQSMIIHNETTLISVNNQAKIVGVNSNDFTLKYEVLDLVQPRFFAELDDEHVVASAWGETGFNGSIYKIKSSTGEIVNSVEITGAPEKMLVNDGKIYVTMSNGFQSDNRLVILNANDLSVKSELVITSSPNSIALDANDDIWVTSSGFSDFAVPANNTSGALTKIVGDQIAETYLIANGSKEIALDETSVYFLNGSGLVKASKTDISQADTLITGTYYTMGLNARKNDLWVANAKDFASDGEVTRIDKDGNIISTYITGIVPGDFYFVK